MEYIINYGWIEPMPVSQVGDRWPSPEALIQKTWLSGQGLVLGLAWGTMWALSCTGLNILYNHALQLLSKSKTMSAAFSPSFPTIAVQCLWQLSVWILKLTFALLAEKARGSNGSVLCSSF